MASSRKPISGPGAKESESLEVRDDDSEVTISNHIASPKQNISTKRNPSPIPEPSTKKSRTAKLPIRSKAKGKTVEETAKTDEQLDEIQPSQAYDHEKWQGRGIMIGRIYLLDELKLSGWDIYP